MLRRIILTKAGTGAGTRALGDEASTLLAEHARRLHTSVAALNEAQTQPAPEATPPSPPPGTAPPAGSGQQPPPSLRAGWTAVPSVAKTLGLAGVIPFIVLSPPVAAHIPYFSAFPDVLDSSALLQVGYGATIASFLGGIHWGAAMLDWRPGAEKAALERYLWGVTPCLMAWPAVAMPPGPGALAVATTLGIAHAVDRTFTRRGLMPPWYMSLRAPLTTLAVSGLLLTVGADVMADAGANRQLDEGDV